MRFSFTQRTMKRFVAKKRRRSRFDWRAMLTRLSQSLVLRLAVFTSVVVFGVGYIVAMSNVSTKGYEMRSVERDIVTMKEDNQKLRLEIAQHRSLHSIQNRIATIGLVPVEGITYVSLEGTSVAQR